MTKPYIEVQDNVFVREDMIERVHVEKDEFDADNVIVVLTNQEEYTVNELESPTLAESLVTYVLNNLAG